MRGYWFLWEELEHPDGGDSKLFYGETMEEARLAWRAEMGDRVVRLHAIQGESK